jgi:hypothetical protein
LLKCFENLIKDIKEIDEVVNRSTYENKVDVNKELNTEDKVQEVYQKIRDIFGENANVFISVNGNNVSTRVFYSK